MAVKLANNATSTLAAPITNTDTVVTVQVGDAAKFPSMGAGEWFPLAVIDSSSNREIMKVTARSGASLTVVRAQEGTTAIGFAAGSKCELRATAVVFTSLTSDIAGKAALVHTHDQSDVTDLVDDLAGIVSAVAGISLAVAGKEPKTLLATKSTNYTAVSGDNSAIFRFTAGATLSLAAAASLGENWHCTVFADGGTVVIDPNGSETVNGAANLAVPAGYSATLICTGSAFIATTDGINANGKVAKVGDVMLGNLEISNSAPSVILNRPTVMRARWVIDASANLVWQEISTGTAILSISSGGDITTSLIGSLTAALAAKAPLIPTLGAVGDRVFAICSLAAVAYGDLVAGGTLLPSNGAGAASGATLSGTWRCQGRTTNANGGPGMTTEFLKVL